MSKLERLESSKLEDFWAPAICHGVISMVGIAKLKSLVQFSTSRQLMFPYASGPYEILCNTILFLGKRPSELCYCTFSRYVNHPAAVADATQRLWPMFKAIFDQ